MPLFAHRVGQQCNGLGDLSMFFFRYATEDSLIGRVTLLVDECYFLGAIGCELDQRSSAVVRIFLPGDPSVPDHGVDGPAQRAFVQHESIGQVLKAGCAFVVKFEQGMALRYSDATAFGFPTEVDADFILQAAKRMTETAEIF